MRRHIDLRQLLRQFDFTINNPIVPIQTFCNGNHMQTDMFVRVTERKSDIKQG